MSLIVSSSFVCLMAHVHPTPFTIYVLFHSLFICAHQGLRGVCVEDWRYRALVKYSAHPRCDCRRRRLEQDFYVLSL
jgi:hypothetical protein